MTESAQPLKGETKDNRPLPRVIAEFSRERHLVDFSLRDHLLKTTIICLLLLTGSLYLALQAQPLELGLPDADAGRPYVVDDELELAARLVEGDVTVGEDLGAVLKGRAAHRPAEHRDKGAGTVVSGGQRRLGDR